MHVAIIIIIIIIINIYGGKREMGERVSALKARKNLGELLDKAYYKGDSFIIERAGKELAAIISLKDYKILTELKKKNVAALRNIWEKIGTDEISEEDITEAIAKIRSNS